MTENILTHIQLIDQHLVEIHQKLQMEQSKVLDLLNKNQELTEKIEFLEAIQVENNDVILNLKSDLASAKNQVIEIPLVKNDRTNEEIDELVHEIEYCISQLKK